MLEGQNSALSPILAEVARTLAGSDAISAADVRDSLRAITSGAKGPAIEVLASPSSPARP